MSALSTTDRAEVIAAVRRTLAIARDRLANPEKGRALEPTIEAMEFMLELLGDSAEPSRPAGGAEPLTAEEIARVDALVPPVEPRCADCDRPNDTRRHAPEVCSTRPITDEAETVTTVRRLLATIRARDEQLRARTAKCSSVGSRNA